MCEVHGPLASVAMVDPGHLVSWRPNSDSKPGFMALSREEYSAEVRQEPFEKYFTVQETPISMGQWASVYKCLELCSGDQFAAKFCSKTRLGVDSSREIMHEVAAMYHARGCARVVRLHQVFETPHQLILVMELGSGGDLQGVLDNDQVPYEPDVVRFINNLLEGLAFLHDRNIAHLDIKPQNLVLTGTFPDCDIKLCDLEISRVISAGQEIREMLGTPDYVSPEILRFEPVTLAADMWSVGVLAYVLLTGFTPFGGDTDAETFRNIARAELEFPDELFEDVSASAKDFIRRCLAKEPRERLTASEAVTHRWLTPPNTPASPPILTTSESFASSEDLLSTGHPASTLRRSISKSREVLSVKVNRSNLKKNISKSRERLCDMKFVSLPMRPDQFPLCLRASTSDVPNSRPPWKGTGCRGPIPSASATAIERINTFKVRDEYQCQVASGLAGSCQSLEAAPSPFVRHGSLRGRRKTSTPNGSSTDIRSSLRRCRNTESAMNRRNSCQEESRALVDAGKKEGPKRTHSASDAILQAEKGDSLTKSPLLSVEEDKQAKDDVETFSDDDDVFTRLYKDYRKDTEPKSKLMADKCIGHNDDEKENLISTRSSTPSGEKSRIDSIKSPVCSRRQSTHKMAEHTGQDKKLGTAHLEMSNGSKQPKHHQHCRSTHNGGISKAPSRQETTKSAMSSIPSSSPCVTGSGVRQTSPRRQVSPRRRQTPSASHHGHSKLERRNTVDMSHPSPSATPSLRRQSSVDRSDLHQRSSAAPGAGCHRAVGADAVRLAAILDEDVVWEQAQTLTPATARGKPTVQSSRSLSTRKPRDTAERIPHEPVLERTTPLRSSLRSSARQTRTAHLATSRPVCGEESRRPPAPAADEAGRGLRKSSTDEDMRRLSSQEQAGRRVAEVYRQLRKSSTEEDVRRLSAFAPDEVGGCRIKSSSDWVGRGLRKSSTEEDVRQIVYVSGRDDRRQTVHSRSKAVPFLRSASLTSDPGSEQSDTSGELYNVTAWEERGESACGATCATELRPVTTCRLARRPRARTNHSTPAPTSPRLTPTSNVAPGHDDRPVGSVFNNAVSRAVKRFQALTDDVKQRDVPSAPPKSPRSPRKAPSPAARSPCVTRRCPSPAVRSLSPRGKAACERAARPHGQ